MDREQLNQTGQIKFSQESRKKESRYNFDRALCRRWRRGKVRAEPGGLPEQQRKKVEGLIEWTLGNGKCVFELFKKMHGH